jgi:hypothetical protein
MYLRRKSPVDQGLTVEKLLCRHIDARHELEPEEGLSKGAPDRLVHDLGARAARAHADPVLRLSGQPIERTFGSVREERAHVGLEVAEGVRFVEPAQDELGRGERGFDPREAALGGHGSPSGSSPDADTCGVPRVAGIG